MPINDADLVMRLQRRETEAVKTLLDQYSDRLYNYLYYHSGDHHLAEDITSETLVRVIEKVSGYTSREVPFRAWVFRIAHNLLVDHFRQRNRYRPISLETADRESALVVTSPGDWGAADGGALACQIAEREELQQAIASLPEDQRTVFILRFIEGLELGQVAALLEKSLAAIKSLQYRAVLQLRARLTPAQSQERSRSLITHNGQVN